MFWAGQRIRVCRPYGGGSGGPVSLIIYVLVSAGKVMKCRLHLGQLYKHLRPLSIRPAQLFCATMNEYVFFFCLLFSKAAPNQTPMCLIDAEDYSDLPVRQYEEDNVLRELNKAYLGFRQHYPETARTETVSPQQPQLQQRLPPVGASRDSSPSSSRQASTATGEPGTQKHRHSYRLFHSSFFLLFGKRAHKK